MDATRRDTLCKHTDNVIEASLEMCRSTRANLARSETIVRLSRQTVASSIALLSRVKRAALSGYL